MIEIIKQQLKNSKSVQEKINYLREFLQIMVLKNIYEQKAFNNIAFLGGTALRILFDINRFSEDLDFSLINKICYCFFRFCQKIFHTIVIFCLNKTSKSIYFYCLVSE